LIVTGYMRLPTQEANDAVQMDGIKDNAPAMKRKRGKKSRTDPVLLFGIDLGTMLDL